MILPPRFGLSFLSAMFQAPLHGAGGSAFRRDSKDCSKLPRKHPILTNLFSSFKHKKRTYKSIVSPCQKEQN